MFVHGFSLDFEDLDIGCQQVLPLHTLLPGHGTHQESSINILEPNIRIVSSFLSNPSFLGMAPTRKAASISLNPTLGSSVASSPTPPSWAWHPPGKQHQYP